MKDLNQFTNLYQVSKTLRFELQPIGRTAKKFNQWIEEMKREELVVDNDGNFFAKDKNIKKAYLAIKPIMDRLHEQFIEMALLSKEAKQIDFSEYFEAYRKKTVNIAMEKELRKAFAKPFQCAGRCFIEKISKAQKDGKEIKTKKDKQYECLTDAKMYNYLSANVKEIAEQNGIDELTLDKHIKQFKSFWGYLDGYNQNRENYYEVEKEASTAVATRIVHENLPTFCDNAIRFEKRKEDYLCIYPYLKDNSRETKIKNSKGEEIEVETISDEIFQIKHFNECLAQSQIEEYNRIIGNYNYMINLYNQLRRSEKDFKKIDEFEKLYKQIGCGKKKSLFDVLIKDKHCELKEEQKKAEKDGKAILTVQTLLQRAKSVGDTMFKKGKDTAEIRTVPDFIQFLQECKDWNGVYMSSSAVNKISNLYFANWHSVKDKLKEAKASACITYDKNREEPIKLRDAVELSELFAVLDEEQSEHFFKESLFKDVDTNEYRGVLNKALTSSQNLINLLCYDIERNIKVFQEKTGDIIVLDKYKDDNNQAGEEDENIIKIKEWFDAATDAMRIVRYFAVRKSKMKGNMPNVTMEQALNNLLYNDDAQWFKWYDLVRNYLTKKPQDDAKENKLKLNFDKSNLLKGFVDSYSESDNATQYGGYIFRKKHEKCNEYEYYLGISKNSKLFRCHLSNEVLPDDKSEYERLNYYQMKSTTPYPNKYNTQKEEIRDIVKELLIKAKESNNSLLQFVDNEKTTPTKIFEKLDKNHKFILKNKKLQNKVNETIETIKSNLINYSRISDIQNLQNINYKGIEGLKMLIYELKRITDATKIFDFFPVSSTEFNNHNGIDLFLFKISNKDLSYCETFATGKRKEKTNQIENLHTLLFRALMHEDGFGDVVDLGKGEVFLREKVFVYDEDVRKYGHHYNELKDKFNYPIISNKRFSEDKLLLHLSIILNYNSENKNGTEVNASITNVLQQSDNLQFIGIDRGEKHLVYSCTIDKEGKIVKCNHHDNINGTNYVQKLEDVADERIIAKKNWQAQNKIKDLKNGYISHVVHRLVEETIKDDGKISPHAYIVLEDLNTEMKRGRQKIEKQVYQKLETALAKKLNFVVDKNAKQGEIGSVSKALQLTPPINNYQDIEGKKQFGVMLYTRANYTSVTDPATGWRKTIYIKNGTEKDIKNQILEKFSDFGFYGKDYFFEYTEANAGHKWRLYSGKNGEALPRFQNKKQTLQDKNVWVPEIINVVDILDKLFKSFDRTKSFKKQIENGVELNKIERRDETAWQSLRFALDVIQQIRNSGEKNSKDDNFLYSPVRNDKGEHFDTRNHKNNGDLKLIVDADANGAFNIARKGLIMDAHIKYWINNGRPMKSSKKDEKTSDLDLFISDIEWDLWLLDRDQWRRELPTFASRSAKEDNTESLIGKKKKK